MIVRRCLKPPSGAALAASKRYSAVIPALESERVILRAPTMADFPSWEALMVPDADGHLGGPHSEEEAWEAFCVYVAGWLLHGHGLWTIVERSAGGVVGFVLVGLEWDDEEPELGWMVLPEFRGQGLAGEAAVLARDHGLALFGAGGLVSYVDPENTSSGRLAARLGARRDRAAEAGRAIHIWRHGEPA